ncbi:hypothetical protein F4778DRAFT_192501 [Xylariomycetidae sp. FL2044]|nr:hypothetical protein F4778DRAFT_192501 [Xylariomycetidae sp. FL2044]
MEEDNRDSSLWRRSNLGEEPIYCAAPPPSNPDDILCPGSDDGLDEDAKFAKRLRYEEQGQRYLQGKPLQILSASLKGPFDRASGWQNPWLPKPRNASTKPNVVQVPVQTIPAIKKSLRRTLEKILEGNDSTPGADNSMLCHLPSPQSHVELDLTSELDSEKRRRIRSWAEDIPAEPLLEKDDFWAPKPIIDGLHREASRKRPVGKDWLKNKPSKRQRPDNSQSSAPASSPTPAALPPTLPRSVSAPAHSAQRRHSKLMASSLNQSFQMTTPSSSDDKKHVQNKGKESLEASISSGSRLTEEALSNVEHESLSNNPDDCARRKRQGSDHQSECSTLSSIPSTISDPWYPIRPQGPGFGTGSLSEIPKGLDTTAPEVHNNQAHHVASSKPRIQQTDDADASFESYIDDSFQYRARPQKQNSLIEAEPDSLNADPSQGCKFQNEESPPLQLEDNMAVDSPSLHQDKEARAEAAARNIASLAEPDALPDRPARTTPKEACRTGQAYEQFDVGDETEIQSLPAEPGVLAKCGDTAEVRSPASVGNEAAPVSNDLQIPVAPSVPQTVLDVKLGRRASPPGMAPTNNEDFSDHEDLVVDGSTLIGDPMNLDDPEIADPTNSQLACAPGALKTGDADAALASISCDEGESPSLLESSSILGNPEDASASETSLIVVPLSQLEWGVVEVASGLPVDTPGATEPTKEFPKIKVERVIEEDEDMTMTAPQPPEMPVPQSPWVSEAPPGDTLGIKHVKTEPMEDEPSGPPDPSHITTSSPPPQIRPSQQSPWAEEPAIPMTMDQQSAIVDPVEQPTLVHINGSEHRPESLGMPGSPPFIAPMHMERSRSSPAPPGGDPVFMPRQTSMSPTNFPPSSIMCEARPSTPGAEGQVSIKSFARFNTPSPMKRTMPSTHQRSSTGGLRSILASNTKSNPWSSVRSSRRVSFAPLPGEEQDDTSLLLNRPPRAASPPPQTLVESGEADMDHKFQNHFDVVKRRVSGEEIPKFRFKERLLPSSSQQRPTTPEIGAMAEAFRDADAQQAALPECMEDAPMKYDPEEQSGLEAPQSPWQAETQEADVVADVMGNLDEFLGAWDIDTEMEKARADTTRLRRSGSGIGTFDDHGIWD